MNIPNTLIEAWAAKEKADPVRIKQILAKFSRQTSIQLLSCTLVTVACAALVYFFWNQQALLSITVLGWIVGMVLVACWMPKMPEADFTLGRRICQDFTNLTALARIKRKHWPVLEFSNSVLHAALDQYIGTTWAPPNLRDRSSLAYAAAKSECAALVWLALRKFANDVVRGECLKEALEVLRHRAAKVNRVAKATQRVRNNLAGLFSLMEKFQLNGDRPQSTPYNSEGPYPASRANCLW